jgi:16S rRNA processing protein RimM
MFGVSLWAEKNNLSELAEDEYYWSDLIGLTVISQSENVILGRVKELFETGAHAIMVVEPTADSVDGEERLIPWHKQTVGEVNLTEQTLMVDWGSDY